MTFKDLGSLYSIHPENSLFGRSPILRFYVILSLSNVLFACPVDFFVGMFD